MPTTETSSASQTIAEKIAEIENSVRSREVRSSRASMPDSFRRGREVSPGRVVHVRLCAFGCESLGRDDEFETSGSARAQLGLDAIESTLDTFVLGGQRARLLI